MILGTVPVDSSGVAVLTLPQMSSGAHSLTGSFRGSSAFSPSVSPEFKEQWPSSGPGFYLRIAASENRYPASEAAGLEVSAISLADFRQEVRLSCANGLPDGYRCEFSPAIVTGSGNSSLLILPGARTTGLKRPASSWPGMALGVLSLLFLVNTRNRRFRLFAVLIAGSMLGTLSGCGTYSRSGSPAQAVVLTVQGSAGTGPEAIIHSAQIVVHLPVTNNGK
jgi:hypothetical protein